MTQDDWAPARPSPLADVTNTGPRPASAVQVAGYADLREVARGGDSIVYRARQISLDRDVAIKVIQITDPADAARFARELAITVRLGRQHPHIVTVLDTTTTADGEPCLVMEYYDLGSVHDRLRAHGPLPVSDVVTAGTAVADALAFAHANGVLHRDVKPQNILMLPTSYVLSDFGIARAADAGHTATLERFSYRHASPQVLDGLSPTVADDVWSLGSTLFTLLDGRAPFAAADPDDDTALAYLRRVRTAQRRELTRDDIPAELRAFIDHCMAADRDDRLGTAAEALRRLRRIHTEDRSWVPGSAAPVAEDPEATVPRDRGSDGVGGSGAGVGGSTASGVGVGGSTASGASGGSGALDGGLGDVAGGAAIPQPAGDVDAADAAWAPTTATSAPADVSPSTPNQPAESEGEPLGLAPAALAPSVLAHVATRPIAADDADADHTGVVVEEPEPPKRRRQGGGDQGGTWRRIAAFLGGALLVGAAIGIGSYFIQRANAPDPTPTQSQTPTTVPSFTGEPVTSGPQQITVVDTALSPRQLAIHPDQGTSVVFSWTEPEQEVALYVLVRIEDPNAERIEITTVGQVQPPLQTITISGLDPDGTECYAVVGVLDDQHDRGLSNIVCRTH